MLSFSHPSPCLLYGSPLSLTSLFFYSGLAGTTWAIIGGVTGGVVVLVIGVGVLTWWLHKKRKCIKDSKSKDQTLLASRRLRESRQQSCLCWPTYECVISNV